MHGKIVIPFFEYQINKTNETNFVAHMPVVKCAVLNFPPLNTCSHSQNFDKNVWTIQLWKSMIARPLSIQVLCTKIWDFLMRLMLKIGIHYNPSLELIIFTKFHNDRVKIVDYLMAYFWTCNHFFCISLRSKNTKYCNTTFQWK